MVFIGTKSLSKPQEFFTMDTDDFSVYFKLYNSPILSSTLLLLPVCDFASKATYTKAEFLDVSSTKVFRVFLLGSHSHLY
jgi:hypothetical protein